MNRKLFPIEITEPKISGFLLVEGINDAIFFSVMLNYLDLGSSVQVAQMGGIDKLDQSLEALIKLDEFFQLKNLGVIRDADDDSSKAFQKVRNSLKRFNLPAPDQAYEYVRVAVAIVPDANSEGNLETLCLRTLDKSKLACIEKYIDCITRNNTPVKEKDLSHAKLYSYLAVGAEKSSHHARHKPGLRVGESAEAGVWKWDSSEFVRIKEFLLELSS